MICKQCGWSSDKKQRSSSQNRYYFGVVLPRISEHTGFTTEEAHEVLKYRFLKSWKTIKTTRGHEEVEYIRSTTDLNTSEFEAYMSKVREFSSQNLQCWVPEPHESLQ